MVTEQKIVTKQVLSQQLQDAGITLMNMSREILTNDKLKDQDLGTYEAVQIHLDSGIISFLQEVHLIK